MNDIGNTLSYVMFLLISPQKLVTAPPFSVVTNAKYYDSLSLTRLTSTGCTANSFEGISVYFTNCSLILYFDQEETIILHFCNSLHR